MELTEFDDLMKSLIEEKEVPNELNLKLKNKLNNKYRLKKVRKAIPASLAACLVIGVVLTSVMHNNQEIAGEKNAKQAVVAHNISADTAQVEAYSRAGGQGVYDEATLKQSKFERATLSDYLENNQDLIENVSEKVKEKMSADDTIIYFKDFTSITGNENFYLTEENELVIIFEPGVVAKEENGEIYFNVGIVK